MSSGLPLGWAVATIGELIAIDGVFSDGDWIESKDQDPEGSIRLLQLADIGDGYFLDKSNRFINSDVFQALKCTEVSEGDVLVARMPDPLGRACLAPKLDQRCITVVDVAILRPGASSVNPAWLMHFINSPKVRKILELQSSGTTRKRISRSKLGSLEIPVPPLTEQGRIVEKLDAIFIKINGCRTRLQEVKKLIAHFRSRVLEAATSGELTQDWRDETEDTVTTQVFEGEGARAFDGYKFPSAWSIKKLSEIAVITGGVTKDSKKQDLDFVELPYLRVANVQRGYLDLSVIKAIRVPPNKVEDLLLAPGDILFNEGGDLDKLGRGWVWEGQIPECTFQNHVFRGRLLSPDDEPRYVSWYSNSRGHNYFLRHGRQTTNLASINKTVLSALPIALPPSQEQSEIVRRVEKLLHFADRVDASCDSAFYRVESMRSAIISKAFRGELVAQNMADASASSLLNVLANAKLQKNTAIKKILPKPTEKRAAMKKNDMESLKGAVLNYGAEKFSFEELRRDIPADYESLKAVIFELLADSSSALSQVFDENQQEMLFRKVPA